MLHHHVVTWVWDIRFILILLPVVTLVRVAIRANKEQVLVVALKLRKRLLRKVVLNGKSLVGPWMHAVGPAAIDTLLVELET
jgi:uncharacterized membrane protein YqiK